MAVGLRVNLIKQAEKLEVSNNGETLYYLLSGDIYKHDIQANQLQNMALITHSGSFYGLGYDPVDNALYATDILDYTQNGQVFKYDASTGVEVFNFKAGIIPGEFYFTD